MAKGLLLTFAAGLVPVKVPFSRGRVRPAQPHGAGPAGSHRWPGRPSCSATSVADRCRLSKPSRQPASSWRFRRCPWCS
ncbi:MAG: hypothetical protein MZV70_28810 [Desulfobacterales bacterium]|nr:hypothetical protein [Desulfobacterales bacterium]